ncbi:hypothetical protein J4460_07335 [Candidatus Woesearchaeota archaeon]|nr:hypothetical protein [Candidatus Woesearchaeota archaeon]HIH38349.1 hypothetical protein [Candidatus Woesearchaeota archaeon]HIH49358.1 hypothetical protein [Candidatus Woesearchaeota archaeon]HIJ03514.1 hypothetical protein [Candidatus Woesearchaeota archaeon]
MKSKLIFFFFLLLPFSSAFEVSISPAHITAQKGDIFELRIHNTNDFLIIGEVLGEHFEVMPRNIYAYRTHAKKDTSLTFTFSSPQARHEQEIVLPIKVDKTPPSSLVPLLIGFALLLAFGLLYVVLSSFI